MFSLLTVSHQKKHRISKKIYSHVIAL